MSSIAVSMAISSKGIARSVEVNHSDIMSSSYDAVQDQPYISVPKTSEFQSCPRVVKMVLNTQYYQYLWLTM